MKIQDAKKLKAGDIVLWSQLIRCRATMNAYHSMGHCAVKRIVKMKYAEVE